MLAHGKRLATFKAFLIFSARACAHRRVRVAASALAALRRVHAVLALAFAFALLVDVALHQRHDLGQQRRLPISIVGKSFVTGLDRVRAVVVIRVADPSYHIELTRLGEARLEVQVLVDLGLVLHVGGRTIGILELVGLIHEMLLEGLGADIL